MSAADLQRVAKSREKEVSEEQCEMLAAWAACSEPDTLLRVLRMELRGTNGEGAYSLAQVEPGSPWLGDPVCMYYPLSKRSKAVPKPILSVLREDLGYRTRFRESTAGGCQVGYFYRTTSDGAIVSKDLHLVTFPGCEKWLKVASEVAN